MAEGGYDSDNAMITSDVEMHEEREMLYALRDTNIDALGRFFDEVADQEAFEALTESELHVRKERIQKHFDDMERAHLLYRQGCLLASNEVYVNLEEKFMRSMAMIEDRLKGLNHNELGRFHTTENSTMTSRMPTVIRVETARSPQIGKFNGNPSDWPAFRDLFIAEVHSRDFDPVTKLLYLQKACIERAADTLGPWQPTADNYAAAWDVMMQAYDDEYHVIHGILGKMFAVKHQEKESHNTLRSILDALNGGTRQLEAVSQQPMLWDQVWIHYAKRRLPKQTLDAWEQHRNRNGTMRLPTLVEFKSFLDTKAKGRHEFEDESNWQSSSTAGGKIRQEQGSNRFKPWDKDRVNKSGVQSHPFKQTEAMGQGRSNACVVPGCKQNHYLWQCEAFRLLSVADRYELTRQHRLCRCCLQGGHMATACVRSGCAKCPDAKFKHHFRLCPKTISDDKTSAPEVKTGAIKQ